MDTKDKSEMNRRDFVLNSTKSVGGILAASMLPGIGNDASAQNTFKSKKLL